MFLLMHVVAAVLLVFLGYIALWSSFQQHIPDYVAKFGKVMAIVLYVIAGLVLIFSIASFRCGGMCCMGWHGHMGKPGMEMMGKMGKMEKGMCMQKSGEPCECEESEVEPPSSKEVGTKK